MSQPVLSGHNWTDKAFLNGWHELQGGHIEVKEPATNTTLIRVANANAEDMGQACRLARQAQTAWYAMPYAERAAIFRKAAQLLEQHQESYAQWIIRETGGIAPKAMFEINSVQHLLYEAAAMLTQPQGLVLPSQPGSSSVARRVPHGVVGVISPFNFPFLLSSRAVLPALATGNAVVLKPDPRTPVSGGFILAQLLSDAGLPDGIFNMLPGDAHAGEALVIDPNIAMISFTGSTAAGRRIGELAGRHLKKVALELGGKNSFIILDDADLELAVSGGTWASWLHQGQICMSAGRHLVHESIATSYAQRMVEKANSLPIGDPASGQVALGPLISQTQAERVHRLVQDSVRMGAQLLAGGNCNGNYYQPTVLSNITPDMPVFKEEIFGPVVAISTFSTDEEAIRLANDTEYGLSAGIHTANIGRGIAIANQLQVGLVHINDQTVNDDGTMPMGGRGASGNGSRHGGPANWDEFTQWQWMTIRNTAPHYPL